MPQKALTLSRKVDGCKPLVRGEPPRHHSLHRRAPGRGLHSFMLELNLSNSRTHSRVKLGYAFDRRAQVELKWERVTAPGAGTTATSSPDACPCSTTNCRGSGLRQGQPGVTVRSTWGQHGVTLGDNLGSTWGQSRVNLDSTLGQPGVNLGSAWGQHGVNMG